MEFVLFATAGAGVAAWCYWRRCLRVRRSERDRAYWEQVRSECPACGVNRRTAEDGAPGTG